MMQNVTIGIPDGQGGVTHAHTGTTERLKSFS